MGQQLKRRHFNSNDIDDGNNSNIDNNNNSANSNNNANDVNDCGNVGCGFGSGCSQPQNWIPLPNILSLHFRSALSPFPAIKLVFVEPQSVRISCTIEHGTLRQLVQTRRLKNKQNDSFVKVYFHWTNPGPDPIKYFERKFTLC